MLALNGRHLSTKYSLSPVSGSSTNITNQGHEAQLNSNMQNVDFRLDFEMYTMIGSSVSLPSFSLTF